MDEQRVVKNGTTFFARTNVSHLASQSLLRDAGTPYEHTVEARISHEHTVHSALPRSTVYMLIMNVKNIPPADCYAYSQDSLGEPVSMSTYCILKLDEEESHRGVGCCHNNMLSI